MRGSVSLPALAKQTGWTLIGAAAVFSPIMVGSLYWQRQMLLIALWSMPALAVMVLVGFSGELFIGQLAIFAVGAFASAQLTETTGWPFFGAVLASTVIAGLAGGSWPFQRCGWGHGVWPSPASSWCTWFPM